MAAARAETVETASHRAELESVLSSQEFVRAPRLAHLLSYLCEKTFAGETNQIKEYSVALEVFNRGASFDQDSDSIVRVEANRLRKRLAEYYASDGASHAIQITIPVGQYVPRFEVRHKVPDQNEQVPSPPQTLSRERKWSTGPRRIIAIGGGSFLNEQESNVLRRPQPFVNTRTLALWTDVALPPRQQGPIARNAPAASP